MKKNEIMAACPDRVREGFPLGAADGKSVLQERLEGAAWRRNTEGYPPD